MPDAPLESVAPSDPESDFYDSAPKTEAGFGGLYLHTTWGRVDGQGGELDATPFQLSPSTGIEQAREFFNAITLDSTFHMQATARYRQLGVVILGVTVEVAGVDHGTTDPARWRELTFQTPDGPEFVVKCSGVGLGSFATTGADVMLHHANAALSRVLASMS